MKDPASEEEQRKAEAELDAALIAFEIGLLAIIAERLGSIEGLSFSEIYALIPEDIAKIRKAITKGIGNLQSVTSRILDRMAIANDEWAKRYYEARGTAQTSAFNHLLMKKTLDREKKAALDSLSVYCRSSVVAVGNRKFVPVEEAYRQTITKAATAMQAGKETLQKAVKQSVQEMAKNGVRVQYQSGVTRNLQTAVRTNVMDSYRTAMSEIREIQGREFGADGVEVSAHALCAPDHLPYQGMQYSYERKRGYELWDDIQNQPDRPLVTGANCGHTIFPVILGISSGAYTRAELEELKQLSNKQVTFKGLSGQPLTMTRYEASQYQRKMETNIRKYKQEAYLQDASKTGDPTPARRAARALSKQYRDISKQMGLDPRPDLLRVYAPK